MPKIIKSSQTGKLRSDYFGPEPVFHENLVFPPFRRSDAIIKTEFEVLEEWASQAEIPISDFFKYHIEFYTNKENRIISISSKGMYEHPPRNSDLNLSRDDRIDFIPAQIAKLIHIFKFKWCNTNLKDLPQEFGKLKNLKNLDLSKNVLLRIPSCFSDLNKIEFLILSKNKIESIPSHISHLKKLIVLDLSENQINVISDEIGSLSNLRQLFLQKNHIKLLPDTIGDLRTLRKLRISDNSLQSIPDSIGQLINMESLSLFNNHLEHLPEPIGNLSKLRDLFLDHNRLLILPTSLGLLPKLKTLTLHNNCLTHLNLSFSKPRMISRLSFANNNFPASLATLSSFELQDLTFLDLWWIADQIIQGEPISEAYKDWLSIICSREILIYLEKNIDENDSILDKIRSNPNLLTPLTPVQEFELLISKLEFFKFWISHIEKENQKENITIDNFDISMYSNTLERLLARIEYLHQQEGENFLNISLPNSDIIL